MPASRAPARARLSHLIAASRSGRDFSPSGLVRGLIYSVRVVIQVVKLWFTDSCPQKAAALTFTTALSLVPIMGVALAVLDLTGALKAQSAFVDFLARQVLPDIERTQIVSTVVSFSKHISIETVGIPGLAATLFVGFMLFHNIEGIFNQIWRIDRNRPLTSKFFVFYTLVTMVPPLLGYTVYQATIITDEHPQISYLIAAGGTFASLFLTNKLLPATRVRILPALIGSIFGAALIEVAKLGFRIYVSEVALKSYSGIYGRFGLVPIFLVWMYVTWNIVLLSAEISHALQNLPALEREHGRRDLEDELFQKFSGAFAARLLCAVAEHYQAGGQGLSRTELCARFDASEDVVERVFHRLKRVGLAIEVEQPGIAYLPGRPASDIQVDQIMAAFGDGGGVMADGGPSEASNPRLEAILADIAASARTRTAVSLADLIRPDPVDPEVIELVPAGPDKQVTGNR